MPNPEVHLELKYIFSRPALVLNQHNYCCTCDSQFRTTLIYFGIKAELQQVDIFSSSIVKPKEASLRYKAKLFQEATFSSSFLHNLSKHTKWPWKTWQASSIHLRHVTSLLSTPLPICTSIITLGK